MEEMHWNKESLYRLVKSRLGDSLFVVASNREPYVHTMSGSRIECTRPVGGVTEALDPVMRASKGTWVAQGTGDADRKVVDEYDRIAVPPEKPEYTLRRVWLTDEEVAGFYLGFANEVLWPLCHVTFNPPDFRENWWYFYKKVNRIFADAILQEIDDRKAAVLVQDYHFALVSAYLKDKNPDLTVGQFWHIPWPTYDIFRTCPWHEELLIGMLGNDLLGFHTQSFCNNFIESVERSLEARTDREREAIIRRGNTTFVEPFPISIDFDGIAAQAATDEVEKEMQNFSHELELEGKILGIGIDRMDYTKGIPERLMALDRLLAENPQYRGKLVFVQAGMPSRTQIDIYKQTGKRIDDLMSNINDKFATDNWKPIVPMTRQLSPTTLNALRRLARFCIVSSLHDGMNLVAKEYVAAQVDGDGVLILSEFTGAAVELQEAVLINPFDIANFSGKIKQALEMPEAERRRRMKNLRQIIEENNIYRWGGSMVTRLISIAGV
jgi:alpha,alpha-trehalose-phosphate synthase [UDP-forming]